MNERVVQFRVGVMVLATAIITAILILLFDGFPALVDRPYTIYIVFREAPGISAGSPIRKSGILIGRVSKVEFVEDRPDLNLGVSEGIVVTADIEAKRRLYVDEVAQIGKSLLGDAVIEFVGAKPDPDKQTLQPGAAVRGAVASDPLQLISNLEGNLATALNSISRTADEISVLARRVSDALGNNNEQIVRIVNKLEMAVDQTNSTLKSADSFLSDPDMQASIKEVTTSLPQALTELRSAVGSMQNTMAVADRNLQNMEGFTKPLGERGAQVIENVERVTANLDRAVVQISRFTEGFQSQQGTVGKLLNDPTLYNQLTETVENINCLTRDLKPILRDARAFSDKIARHPEQLGIRGAIQRSSGIK